VTPRADASEKVRMKAPLKATLRADARQMVRVRAALMASKKDRQTGVDLGSVLDPGSDTDSACSSEHRMVGHLVPSTAKVQSLASYWA